MDEISCSETTTPLILNIGTLIESKDAVRVAVERCPLCSEGRRPFYCKSCVERGKFIHSNATFPDSYEDIHRKWDLLKRERDHILERFKRVAVTLQKRDAKKSSIFECRQKIEVLKQSLAATKDMIVKDRNKLKTIRQENLMLHKKGKKHKDKQRQIQEYICDVSHAVMRTNERLSENHIELMQYRQKHINYLTCYVFDVSEVKTHCDSATSMGASDDVREALQEACQTAYVRGRWIYSSSQYRIIEATLPSHGEYSQYNVLVAKPLEEGKRDMNSPSHPGNSFKAGLCHTSQMVSILAHILNVCLPKKQPYSDFCMNVLTEKKFNNAVSKLNQNVLFLCFCQGVDTENIEPKHTLHNVLLLIRHNHLGRIGSFDVDQDMMDSVEDSNGQSEESDDDANNCHDDVDSTDWEKVPDNIPLPSVNNECCSQTTGYMSQGVSKSELTASSVFSSAVNTLSSFFRR